MGVTPVTQALWEAVMGSNPSWTNGADRPVGNVRRDDCQEFIRKLNAFVMYVTRSSDAVTFSFDPSARIRLREIPPPDGALDLSSRVTVAVGSNPSFEKVVEPLLPYVMPLLAGIRSPEPPSSRSVGSGRAGDEAGALAASRRRCMTIGNSFQFSA